MKHFSFIIALCVAGLSSTPSFSADNNKLNAGDYLASRFAQAKHDWKNANKFISNMLNNKIAPDNIFQRAMILSMGAGEHEKALELAEQVKLQEPYITNTIAEIFLIAKAFKQKNYDKAGKMLDLLPDNETSQFISPFIRGWLYAAQKKIDIDNLRNSTAQLYHGILISDFLDNHKKIENIINRSLEVDEISITELERIADLYAHIGIKDKALNIYKTVLQNTTEVEEIESKIENLEQGKNKPLFRKVKTANEGMARAFNDIASILYNEQNDESAQIFANIALYVDPNLIEAKFLLAEININHKQYENAIKHYKSVPESDNRYIKAQYKIVDIYEKMELYDEALSLLGDLPQNVDTLMRTGDLHRSQGNFGLALKSYDDAVEKLGGKITEKYWHLHYVRGIAHEQLDNWKQAEKELKAALEFQPDHPYVLNYLGYAWADKGINLQQSFAMLKKAVSLRPSDGYITDSLGWVMYRAKDYENAVPLLEQAAALLPYDPIVNDHLGDAYWQVGRRLEAEFQWKRAINYSNDSEQIRKIKSKLISGIVE